MTRMTGLDCAVMCNLINKYPPPPHTHTPNPRKCGDEESYGKVQGSAREGRHGICGMPGGFTRGHDGGPSVKGNLRQEPGVAC